MEAPILPLSERNAVERINVLRGLAILGVIAVHTTAHFTYAPGPSPVAHANVILDVLAHYAAPLFVLLSGLTLARRYGRETTQMSAKSFYARRLTKIVPPYVVFSLFYLLLFALEYQPPAPSWVALALATGSAYYHLWFVALLVQLYLLFPLLLAALRWARARQATGALLALALALQLAWNMGAPVLAAALPDRPLFQTVLSERFFLSHIFYFMLGMVAGLNLEGFERRVAVLPLAPLGVVVVGLVALTSSIWIRAIAGYGSLNDAPVRLFVPAIATEPLLFLSTMALLWRLARRVQGRSSGLANGLAGLGILSFSIYLVHVFFQWLLARWMAPFGVTPADWAFYPVMFVGTVALSYAAVLAFSRLPYGEQLTGAPAARSPRHTLYPPHQASE